MARKIWNPPLADPTIAPVAMSSRMSICSPTPQSPQSANLKPVVLTAEVTLKSAWRRRSPKPATSAQIKHTAEAANTSPAYTLNSSDRQSDPGEPRRDLNSKAPLIPAKNIPPIATH